MQAYPDTLLKQIDAYRARHGLSKSKFGEIMVNDPNLVRDIEAGRELRRSTEASLLSKMQADPSTRGAA